MRCLCDEMKEADGCDGFCFKGLIILCCVFAAIIFLSFNHDSDQHRRLTRSISLKKVCVCVVRSGAAGQKR